MQGNRFKFRGGDAGKLRGSLESLFLNHTRGQKVQAHVER